MLGESCASCGWDLSTDLLEIHHVGPVVESCGLRPLVSGSQAKVDEQLESNCVLLCPNCHSLMHREGHGESRKGS